MQQIQDVIVSDQRVRKPHEGRADTLGAACGHHWPSLLQVIIAGFSILGCKTQVASQDSFGRFA